MAIRKAPLDTAFSVEAWDEAGVTGGTYCLFLSIFYPLTEMLPSDNWKTVQEHEAEDEPSVPAWRQLRLDVIDSIAASLRPPHSCTANRTRYAAGTTSIAVEVVFDDNVVWIFRVRTDHVPGNLSQDSISKRLTCEIGTLRLISESTSIPVPTVFAYTTTPNNPLGFPYVVMSAATGLLPSDIGLPLSGPVPADKEPVFARYCASLADIHLQLSKIRADEIGSVYADDASSTTVIGPVAGTQLGPFKHAAEYYGAYAKRLEDMLIHHDVADDAPIDAKRLFTFWLYRLLLAGAAFDSQPTGPFILTHPDLHISNTLVDETGNIVAVLDWECAAFLPEELFAAQMVLFNDRLDVEFAYAKARFAMYNRALANLPVPHAPGGKRSLADLHASVSCRLLGALHYYLVECTDFDDEDWTKALCLHLMGTEDWRAVMRSKAFQEWLAQAVCARN